MGQCVNLEEKKEIEPWVMEAHAKAAGKRIWGKVTTFYEAGTAVMVKSEETTKPPKKI